MSEMDPVTDEAINSVAQYVAEMAGVPSASDELAMAFVQMQTGIYDLAGAASSAAMIAAGAAASASAAAAMAHQYSAGSQEQYNYNVQQRQKDFSDYSVNFDDLGIEGHAAGGIHGGGWRMVGEDGPELEYTPPSRIFSNTDTNSILSEMRRGQGGDIGPVTVHIHGKGPGLEALIDKVIVTRERQGVTGRAFI
jgi:hypothetical protein